MARSMLPGFLLAVSQMGLGLQNRASLMPTRQLALKVVVQLATRARRGKVVAAQEVSTRDSDFGIGSLVASSLKRRKGKRRRTDETSVALCTLQCGKQVEDFVFAERVQKTFRHRRQH